MLVAFPPDTYTYVSLGSSPTLVTGFIQLTIPNAVVIDLPISDVGVPEIRDLNEHGWQQLLQFARTAFAGRDHARNKLVIVDMIEQGRGVALTKMLLKKYFGNTKTIKIFSLVQVDDGDLQDNPYLSFDEITQIDPKHLTKEQEYFSFQITSCKYKNRQLLRKYDKHNIYKISTGEISAPKKDVVTTCWLFKTLREIIDWLEKHQNANKPQPSVENIDDFMAVARQEIEEIVAIDELPPTASLVTNRDDENDVTSEDMSEDNDDRIESDDDSVAVTTTAVVYELQSWLDAIAFPISKDVDFLISQLRTIGGLTVNNLNAGAEVRAGLVQHHAVLCQRVIQRVQSSVRLDRQQQNAYAAGLELLLCSDDDL
jgi:hypothetical protein